MLALALMFMTVFLGIGAIIPIRTVVARAQGATNDEIAWMGNAYLLAVFAFQIPFGWLSDRLGRRPLLLIGVTLHVILSVLYPFAPGTAVFILLRAIEGVSTAAMMPAARAYIADIIAPDRRGEAFGVFNAALSGGILLGPAAGGFLGRLSPGAPFVFSAVFGFVALLVAIIAIREPIRHAPSAASVESGTGANVGKFRWQMLLGTFFVAAFVMAFGRQFTESLFNALWNVALLDHGWTLDMIGMTYTLFGLPTLVLMIYGGQVADRSRHRAWLYIGSGIAIALIYFGYGFALNSFVGLLALDMLEATLASFAWPIAERYVAAISPENGRGRVQAAYGVLGTLGGVIGTSASMRLYDVNQLVPFVMYAAVGLFNALVAGGIMLYYERRHAAKPDVERSIAPDLIPAVLE